MRFRFALLLGCVLALAAPAAANAKLLVGISENNPQLFADPAFQSLGAKYARIVVEYNVALDPTSPDYNRLVSYLTDAQASGVQPLVAFEHVRGDADGCVLKKNYNKTICKLPSKSAYTTAMKAFFAKFPTAVTIAPWNEENHFSQPTSRDPKAAAEFANIDHSLCSKCTLVVADVLDQPDSAAAKHPVYNNTKKWIKSFRSALKVPRTVCGIHNYSDVNRFRTTGTQVLMSGLGCKQYWLTETGGLYKYGSFWGKSTYQPSRGCKSSSSCQVAATKYMFSVAKKYTKIKRVYVYTWFGGLTKFDAGLVDKTDKPRAALAIVKEHV